MKQLVSVRWPDSTLIVAFEVETDSYNGHIQSNLSARAH